MAKTTISIIIRMNIRAAETTVIAALIYFFAMCVKVLDSIGAT